MSFIEMLVPIILALREGLEAVLVMIIILSYLKKTDQEIYKKYVYLGGLLAILVSIIFAFLFAFFVGGFTGIVAQLFEGYTFVISGIFIVTLVLWISNEGPKMRMQIEEKNSKSSWRYCTTSSHSSGSGLSAPWCFHS